MASTVIPQKYATDPDEMSLTLTSPPPGAAGDPSVARTVFPGTEPPPAAGVAPLRLPPVDPQVLELLLQRIRQQQAPPAGTSPEMPGALPTTPATPRAPAVAPPQPGLFSPQNLTALIERLKQGNAVERAVGAGGETTGQQIGEGAGTVQSGLQELRNQPTLPGGEDSPMGETPNLGALGRTLYGGLQIASAPASGVGRAISELPFTTGEQVTGQPRDPALEPIRQTGEQGLGLVMPLTVGLGRLGRGHVPPEPTGIGVVKRTERALAEGAPYGAEMSAIGAGHVEPPPRVPQVAPDTSKMADLYEYGKSLASGARNRRRTSSRA